VAIKIRDRSGVFPVSSAGILRGIRTKGRRIKKRMKKQKIKTDGIIYKKFMV
jgi:hypothetical protein